jgi:hypothetical protein
MVRLLIRIAIFLVAAALGLLVASWLLPGFGLTAEGFLITIIVFAIVQGVLAPFIAKVASQHARAFLGGVGLVATFVALLIASLFTGGLVISGWQTWILATMVVWLVTSLATFLLPMVFLKKKVAAVRGSGGRTA